MLFTSSLRLFASSQALREHPKALLHLLRGRRAVEAHDAVRVPRRVQRTRDAERGEVAPEERCHVVSRREPGQGRRRQGHGSAVESWHR